MTEIIFVNNNMFWEVALKNLFKIDTLRFYSIADYNELSQWENVLKYIVIIDENYIKKKNITFSELKNKFEFIKNWKLLKNSSEMVDPLIFQKEILSQIKEL